MLYLIFVVVVLTVLHKNTHLPETFHCWLKGDETVLAGNLREQLIPDLVFVEC